MRKTSFRRSAHLSSPWFKTATMAWHGLLEELFNPYRPELHYMRGPGPKWRQKHRIQRVVD